MLIDTLLQLNPNAVVVERDGFVVIEIPEHEDDAKDLDLEARPDADA